MLRDPRVPSAPPQSYARISGVLYLLMIAAGVFAEFVRERLVVPGGAAATAANITAHALLFRLSYRSQFG